MTTVVPQLPESPDGSPSSSLQSASSPLPWYKAPERIAAVAGAIALRVTGHLSEEWLGLVLTAALGAPIATGIAAIVKKVRGK